MTHTHSATHADPTGDAAIREMQELLPLARRAYGTRRANSPRHEASRRYTSLLVAYAQAGGSLVSLAETLDVTYASLRRRVTNASLPSLPPRKRSRLSPEETEQAIARIIQARNLSASPELYHAQLAEEYENGVSLAKVARALGLASSHPLYYGVQRHQLRSRELV